MNQPETPVYIVATVKSWNIKAYHEIIKYYPGKWYLITEPGNLTLSAIQAMNPKFIFFPHWNHIVPEEILNSTTCVCFHETDLPFGRGGSPIQNLIAAGLKETVISAIKMVKELDAGPVYIKRPLSLEGIAEEIFIRASRIVAEMIKTIITELPTLINQSGTPVVFKRRKPEQSGISAEACTIDKLYDHIRMLDAEGYPKAYWENEFFKFEISGPIRKTEEIQANVRIIPKGAKND